MGEMMMDDEIDADEEIEQDDPVDEDIEDEDDENGRVEVDQEQCDPQIHHHPAHHPSHLHHQPHQDHPGQQQHLHEHHHQSLDEQMSHKNHVQLLMEALEKLDPEKNGLDQVPREITSSTLTTRLRGICKINRLIEHSNDLCHSFNEINAQDRFQECISKFRDWILQNRIIEHTFGPNCHVEIIKQSHTILSFVAYSLDDEHVNVIWSASLLKHCGRQVLEVLTSLIRFMRTGPVLHLYWLVKNLSIEDHSEHTLLLTSHILRFIWSHSPCISQLQFCNLQKTKQRHPQQQSQNHQQQELYASSNQEQDISDTTIDAATSSSPIQAAANMATISTSAATTSITRQRQQRPQQSDRSLSQDFIKLKPPFKQSQSQHPPPKQSSSQSLTRLDSLDAEETTTSVSTNTITSPTLNIAATTTVSNSTNPILTNEDHYHWLASCIFPKGETQEGLADDSASSRSTSESVDLDKDLRQSLIDAIKGVTEQQQTHNQQASNSPVNESSVSESHVMDDNPEDEVKQRVVEHILKSITDNSTQSSSHQQKQCIGAGPSGTSSLQCNFDPETNEREWLKEWKANDFLDNTSDVSACCSEEKNMDDFDDDAQGYIQGEDAISSCMQDANASSSGMYSQASRHHPQSHHHLSPIEASKSDNANGSSSRSTHSNIDNKGEIFGINDSSSTSKDSESKMRISFGQSTDHLHNIPQESVVQFKELKEASANLSSVTCHLAEDDDFIKGLSEYNLKNLSESGKTLLWDLLQDGKIEHLATNLHVEVENALVNLVMSFGDRYIRYKFIEACLENLSVGTSVIISLRLLPKLMSFNTITRNLSIPAINETHTIVLWAERDYNMSQNFFKNLVDYYAQRQEILGVKGQSNRAPQATHMSTTPATASMSDTTSGTKPTNTTEAPARTSNEPIRHFEDGDEIPCKSPLFSHIDGIITRMSFLTFIYSKPFSPDNMKLSREQMDMLWDCLASDTNLRCSDVLFQWIYQQAVGDDFHGVNDELLDYVLKHKLPTLSPEHFRLRGLKLLEQLLWIRQDYECCHGLEHPATRLLWDIGLKAVDDEVSMAAIRILNHFYIYTNHQKSTKCDKGINFMNHCMDQLHSTLSNLTNLQLSGGDEDGEEKVKYVNQLLDVMQKVILLIRTHLEVFKAHWSYYLRILQLNSEADLVSHRLNAYEIKLTITIRLVVQAAVSMDKTTIEVQAGDFVGELRAEIVKWYYSQVDRGYFEMSTIRSPSQSASSPSSASNSSSTGSSEGEEEDASRRYNDRQMQIINRRKLHNSTSEYSEDDPNALNTFTEFLLASHHSLRLLSHNQEIPFEWNERQINELDFKDMQMIYVLSDVKVHHATASTDDIGTDKSSDSMAPAQIPKTEIPSILLLRHEYFERLMETDRFLGSFVSKNIDLTNRAKTLSRRVWEIIQILPTCPHYKEDLKRCGMLNEDWRLKSAQCSTLLSAECPQRLLYSLQIIDILKSSHELPAWGSTFIRKGGLADIYDVFMSQKLLPNDYEDWNEWLQECLAYLLKLLFQFGTKPTLTHANESSSSSSSSKFSTSTAGSSRTMITNLSSIKRIRRNKSRVAGVTEDRLPIPLFSDELLKLLENTDLIFNKLVRILKSSALCRSPGDQYYYVTMSSRAMIVHHVMSFLSSWCKSDPKFPKFQIAEHEQLLKALILDDTDSSTRREACNGFYKLHHACCSATKQSNISLESINSTLNSSLDASGEANASSPIAYTDDPTHGNLSSWTFSSDLLKCLIKFLPIAEAMKPPKPIRNYVSENDYIKELNSPGCKDYFWLTCRLIESPATLSVGGSNEKQHTGGGDSITKNEPDISTDPSETNTIASSPSLNMFELCKYLVVAIRNRETYETRDFSVEDDTLKGMLMMMVMALRRDPTFRYTTQAFEFIHELYEYLFAPPNQNQRYLPKCKAPTTRSTAFDLMITLVERCPKNYFGLIDLLLVDQHNSVVKGTYPTDYWPHDDCRSEVGFVGLINLGATCYLATCMQHLFMIPDLRYAILSIENTKSIRHGEIIRELQKIFAFMLESERKAYNPRNFCKVYTMDNHPLNIAEQTDMTEFLTDLITKLEESSPELRRIIKGLFSGTLSNNVVSLDCPHISRTTEEFYTLRVQVADMRNLNDSLDELTIKDTLEGDNMYTCSTCEKKVRAEKRACIVKLPRILCFNTMRYTFNMATMTKEKVNTHFSFPLKLDMADYLETNLMKRQQSSSSSAASTSSSFSSKESLAGSCTTPSGDNKMDVDGELATEEKESTGTQPQQQEGRNTGDSARSSPCCSSAVSEASTSAVGASEIADGCEQAKTRGSDTGEPVKKENEQTKDPASDSDTIYELIGVTVHTGNADGGHYYCFIRDCEDQLADKPRWYLFNDAEVKPFDDSHIGTECYGGELTTKSYDAINDRFMDFSIEKTNSAYMLFYKRVDYKYRSRSVALKWLESDTQRHSSSCPSKPADVSTSNRKDSCEADMETSGREHEDSGATRSLLCSTHRLLAGTDRLEFGERIYDDFQLPKYLANWIWSDNMKFARDKNVFEHNYFNFMWQLCANLPRTLNQIPESLLDPIRANSEPGTSSATSAGLSPPVATHSHASISLSSSTSLASEDAIAIRTVHLAIAFVLGVLMNSRERPNLSNWTELIRKQFNSSKAACDWLMHLIDDEETWLKQMLLKCPIEMVRQLFQRLCNDLTGSKQHKKLRLIR